MAILLNLVKSTIANKFNTFFAGIGVELSANVNNTHNAQFLQITYLIHHSTCGPVHRVQLGVQCNHVAVVTTLAWRK